MEPIAVSPTSASTFPVHGGGEDSRSLERQVFYLHAIARVGRTLARVATLDQLLSEIADYFNELAAAAWTCVYLREGADATYRLRRKKLARVDAAWPPADALAEREVADLLRDPDALRVVEARLWGGGGSCHLLPLFTEGVATGFLLFGERLTGDEIRADEREFLLTLGTQAALAIRYASLLDDTACRVVELRVLNDVARLFTRPKESFSANLHAMWAELEPFLGLEAGLLLALGTGGEDVVLGGTPPGAEELDRVRRWCGLLLDETDHGPQLRCGEVPVLDGSEIESSFPAEFRPPEVHDRSFALLPVFYDHELAAVLVLQAFGPGPWLREHVQMLRHLSPSLSAALQKARDHVKLERLATTDGLTGLYNHRYFHDKLQQEYLRAYRLKDRVGLLFVDVDHFKSVNDAFGHVYGDQVLVEIGGVLKAAVREIDVVARYGGEEFAVTLPQAGSQEAAAIGERVRYAVEALPLRLGRRQRLTVSVGAASYPESASTKEKLVEAADRALYLAKRAGRNRVTLAPPELP